jgi:hypothetical protein
VQIVAKRNGDGDQYGWDDRRQQARGLLEKLAQAADTRPDKPAQQIGKVLKLPEVTPMRKRLLDAHGAIMEGTAKEIAYQHTVLCQTGLPYRPTKLRAWERQQGNVMLKLVAGEALDPHTRKWIEVGLPHGEKPRLVLMHLNTEALRTGSPMVDVENSLTAFVKALGLAAHGRNIRTIRDQLTALSAATIRLGVIENERAVQINGQIVSAFELWSGKDENQRVLWPSTVRLSDDYFSSLMHHAVPLNHTAVAALSGSAVALDTYTWLAQRLHRIPPGKTQIIRWEMLKEQFGPDYALLRQFRAKFIEILRHVVTVYPSAKVDITECGLELRQSAPPVKKRILLLRRPGPVTIDGEATSVTK